MKALSNPVSLESDGSTLAETSALGTKKSCGMSFREFMCIFPRNAHVKNTRNLTKNLTEFLRDRIS